MLAEGADPGRADEQMHNVVRGIQREDNQFFAKRACEESIEASDGEPEDTYGKLEDTESQGEGLGWGQGRTCSTCSRIHVSPRVSRVCAGLRLFPLFRV